MKKETIEPRIEAIEFPEMTTEVAKNQEEYLTLPAMITSDTTDNRIMVTCYKIPFWQRFKMLITGVFWMVEYPSTEIVPRSFFVDKYDAIDKEYSKECARHNKSIKNIKK